MTAFETAIQLRSLGECCSNARVDAKFVENLSGAGTFVATFGGATEKTG
jgi:hypothetical protein